MAKFFITNNRLWDDNIYQQLRTTDFKISFRSQTNNVYAIAVQKHDVIHANAISQETDFCIVTGTCIYKESVFYKQLIDDFSDNISSIRENTIGQYGITICKNNCIRIFGDACGCYDIYYYEEGDNFLVSNSLYEMCLVLKEKLTLDDERVIQRVINRSILNGKTFFKEICRLRGNESININCDSCSFSIQYILPQFCTTNVNSSHEVIVNHVVERIKENARISAKVLGTPVICMTGGLDSRLLLAAYLSVGVKPKLLYGVGNSNITFPEKEDEQCVNIISKKFGLDKLIVDFSIAQPINKDWNYLINNYGVTTAYMWGGSMNIIESLSHLDEHCFLL